MSSVPKASLPAPIAPARLSMQSGWTGGQYSLYRAALGIALAASFAGHVEADAGPTPWLAAAGVGLALALAAGVADRLAAAALLVPWLAVVAGVPPRAQPDALLVPGLLLAHAGIPRAAYGSWTARGRVDPGGDWRMPAPIQAAAWAAQVACAVAEGGAALALAAPLALYRGARPWLWLALLGLHAARIPGLDAAGSWLGVAMLQALCFDPSWIRPRAAAETARLFYDGGCGLCHAAVRFVLAEDPDGRAFRFAPLASEVFLRLLTPQQRAALPDSLVLALPDGRVLVRSRALREIGARLGGLWRALALAAGVVPTRWLDRLYDFVARHRARLFAKPTDVCPILPPALRGRFD